MSKKAGSDTGSTTAAVSRSAARPEKKSFARSAASFAVDTAAFTVGSIFKAIGTVFLILLMTGLIFTVIFAYYVKTCLTPSIDLSLQDYKLSESSIIYYQSSDNQWKELCTLSGRENRIWVDYDQIPKHMINALVAIEDKRFYEHKGVDWYRTSGAFIKMFATMQTNFGGSTITQQLIKNLTGQDDVTVTRKLKEIFSALELEKKYDKTEILEWYMNAVYFGEGAWGVESAAQTYFGKSVSELSLAEGACIVGITNLPTTYDPFYDEAANKKRQELILREMYDQGYITYSEYTDAVNEDISSAFVRSADSGYTTEIYTYYEEAVIADVTRDLMDKKGVSYETAIRLLYNGGYRIYCCLDPDIQAVVDNIYCDTSNMPKPNNSKQQLQSACVIMDPYTGKVLALYGGVGEKTINFGLNRATQTRRPPGSSIKPIASYGPALALGLITPSTQAVDSGYITLNGTSWFPQNDGGSHYGTVTMYRALTLSLNTIAAQIVDKLPEGPLTSYKWLTEKLGVTSLDPEDADYAPMALGQLTHGITVREMATAYSAFPNDGVFTKSRTYTLVTDAKGNTVLDNIPETTAAFDPNTAYCISYMLQNAVNNGTGTEAKLYSMPVAGKTGTTTDAKDRWFVGYTPYYVCAVWTGFDTPERISINGNPAARIWKKVMQPIHTGLEYKTFTYPYLAGDTGLFIQVPVEPEYDYNNDYVIGDGNYGYTDPGNGVVIVG